MMIWVGMRRESDLKSRVCSPPQSGTQRVMVEQARSPEAVQPVLRWSHRLPTSLGHKVLPWAKLG
jgi:hypothetical protein